MDLDNFEVRLLYGVASLCNHLLPEFSSNQFDTLHSYYKHIKDVHVSFRTEKIIFDKIAAFFYLDNFEVRFQYRVASLCKQLLPEFSRIQFENLHRYYKCFEDVHVNFCTQKYNF